MKFSEFLVTKTHCPSCKYKLNLSLSSSRKYNYKIWNDGLLFTTTLRSLKSKKQSFQCEIFINTTTNEFTIDFYDRLNKKMDSYVPISFINGFKEFNKNQGGLSFHKYCSNCLKYYLRTKEFYLDNKISFLDDLDYFSEEFFFHREINENKVLLYNAIIKYDEKKCLVGFMEESKAFIELFTPTGYSLPNYKTTYINIPIIDLFSLSEKENIEKIERFLTFS